MFPTRQIYLISLWIIFHTFQLVNGYASFANKLPNGHRVIHPCQKSKLWLGVGHFSPVGGGRLNPFGRDFQIVGKIWTEELCRKDSDGDGMSNGQELGDPECTWQEGDNVATMSKITHPGICEPIDGEQCKLKSVTPLSRDFSTQEQWLASVCPDTFKCDLNSTDIYTKKIRIPLTSVPVTVTSRQCTSLRFTPPAAGNGDIKEQYLIAVTPIVNNTDVLSRMFLYGCRESVSEEEPFDCGDATALQDCHVISSWSRGHYGDCFHNDTGVLFGSKVGAFRWLILEVLWNNTALDANHMDSSGMTLHFTSRSLQHDVSTLKVGNDFIQIPPQSAGTDVTSICTGSCTRSLLKDSIFVTAVISHLNVLGVGQEISIFRNSQLVSQLVNVNFDKGLTEAIITVMPSPIEIRPGDSIQTVCRYDSSNRNRTTFSGNARPHEAEACYAYLRFYPSQNLQAGTSCVSWISTLSCDPKTEQGCTAEERKKFWSENLPRTPIFNVINRNCDIFGPCTTECRAAILNAKSQEPCMASQEGWYRLKTTILSQSMFGRHFLSAMASCEVEMYSLRLQPRETVDTSPSTREKFVGEKKPCSAASERLSDLFLLFSLYMIITTIYQFEK